MKVYALHVEALLNLYRHEEAHATYQKGPNISIDSCTRLIGPAASAYIMMIEARVYLAAGRLVRSICTNIGLMESGCLMSHFYFFPVHSKFVGPCMTSDFYRIRGTKDFHLHTCKFQLYFLFFLNVKEIKSSFFTF